MTKPALVKKVWLRPPVRSFVLIAALLGSSLVITAMNPEVALGGSGGIRVVRGVVAQGACAIYGMSAEQSQLLALQRARASAIEQAVGVKVASATLVRNGTVAVDLIRTYSRGFVVRETVEWLPIAQYQDSRGRPPIPEYRVRIRADVAIPEKTIHSLGLSANLNNKVFRKGEKARIEVMTQKDSRIAVFNLSADDKVVMVFPNSFEDANFVAAGKTLWFPADGAQVDLVMQTFPGHAKDAEAFFVVAVALDEEIDFAAIFGFGNPIPLTTFFDRFARIASHADEVILPYVVEGNE